MNISGFGDWLLTGSALGINTWGCHSSPHLHQICLIFILLCKQGLSHCVQAGLAGHWGSEGCSPGRSPPAAPTLQFGSWGFHGPPAPPSPTKSTAPVLPSLCDVVWAGFLRKRGTGRGIWTWLVGGIKVFFSQHSGPMVAVEPL